MQSRLLAVALAAALLSACASPADAPTAPGTFTAPVNVVAQHNGVDHQHFAHLNGGSEVPANDSIAQGQANFTLSEDGLSLDFKLNIANIQNVTQAHIHLGPPTGTGGIVVWLYPSGPPAQLIPGRSQGTLAEGTITAASLVNALAGQPLSALLTHIRNNNAYVNVHTSQFPPGEIRGQMK